MWGLDWERLFEVAVSVGMEESGIFLEIEIFLILLISEPKRVCKYKSMQECKYSNMHVVMNPNAQVSNHANNMELLSKPQPNLNTRLGLTIKWLCKHHPTPPTIETQCQEYLSCHWPNFDETLSVGSWEHLEPIPTVTVTFVQATFVLAIFVHISNISAVTGPIWIKL